jgi:hypothetical protein
VSILFPTRRRDRWAEHEQIEEIKWSFRQACVGAGVSLSVDGPIAGTSVRTPSVTNLQLGPPIRLTVMMLPGQVPDQLRYAAHLIAPHLGGKALRVEDRGHGWCLVTLLAEDPLDGVLSLRFPSSGNGVLIGQDENGDAIRLLPAQLPHIATQGQTRSGKSSLLYSLAAQLVRDPAVVIAGIDPARAVLRPFTGTPHAAWQCLGVTDVDAVDRCVGRLVDELDRRLGLIPDDCDVLPLSPDMPLMAILIDEYPSVLRRLDMVSKDVGKRVRAGIARLLCESHKIGFRCVLAAQRAESTILGGEVRAQCGGRISFRVDNAETLKLLHVDAAEFIIEQSTAPPGTAICDLPGRPTCRIRVPHLGDYRHYVQLIKAHAA